MPAVRGRSTGLAVACALILLAVALLPAASGSTAVSVFPGAPVEMPQGVWLEPEIIDSAPGDVLFWARTGKDLAVSPSGDVFAVWAQRPRIDLGRHDIWANRYVVGSGWGDAELLEHMDGYTNVPRVAVDDEGNAVAVWEYKPEGEPGIGSVIGIWSNRYAEAEGWGTAVRLDACETCYARTPSVAMDGAGNAIALWTEGPPLGPSPLSLRSARYVPGEGWSAPENVTTARTELARPLLTVDDDGNALAVWHEVADYYSRRLDLRYSRYVAGSGWGTPSDLEGYDEDSCWSLSLESNGDGVAVVVWGRLETDHVTLWARRYDPAGSWGPETPIGTLAPFLFILRYADVAVDAFGNALVVWSEWKGDVEKQAFYGSDVWSRRYVAGLGWEPPVVVETSEVCCADVQIETTPGGQAFLAWGYGDVRVARYLPGLGWGEPTIVHEGEWLYPIIDIAVDDAGRATLIWPKGREHADYEYDLFASRYEPNPQFPRPPFDPPQPSDGPGGAVLAESRAPFSRGSVIRSH